MMVPATSGCVVLHDKKPQIKPFVALEDLYGSSLPTGAVADELKRLEKHVRDTAAAHGFAQPVRNAFVNACGNWFEALIVARLWNARPTLADPNLLIVKLPNVKTFDFTRLLDKESSDLLDDLRTSLVSSQVQMVTSNPDLVIVRSEALANNPAFAPIADLGAASIRKLYDAYGHIKGVCDWTSIVAGVGLKVSLRPDRRFQLVHEGNIVKSIFAHLRTRHWARDTRLQYYIASLKVTAADKRALQTAVTHTIVNVDSIPEPAVDGFFVITGQGSIDVMASELARVLTK